MQIPVKVISRNGEIETITLEGVEGSHLNHVKLGERDWYFDKEGYYDGWGDLETERGSVT